MQKTSIIGAFSLLAVAGTGCLDSGTGLATGTGAQTGEPLSQKRVAELVRIAEHTAEDARVQGCVKAAQGDHYRLAVCLENERAKAMRAELR